MSYTDRYVSASASGSANGQSEANPWTLSQALSSAQAGYRVNVKAGAYSLAGSAFSASYNGTGLLPIWYRGYYSSPGDLDNFQRSESGLLDTTNFPVFTLASSGRVTFGTYTLLTNMSFSGNYSSAVVALGNYSGAVNCSFEQLYTSTGSTATTAVNLGTSGFLVSCDASFWPTSTSGTSPNAVNAQDYCSIIACRIKSKLVGILYKAGSNVPVLVDSSVIYGCTNGIFLAASYSAYNVISRNTIVNCSTSGIYFAGSASYTSTVTGNIIADCGTGIQRYAEVPLVVTNNYFRGNSTNVDAGTYPNWGLGTDFYNIANAGGSAEEDFVDPTNKDFRVRPSFPGIRGGFMGAPIGAFHPRFMTVAAAFDARG